MLKVYGIKNCSTVKKALDWLDSHQLSYEFHDYKKSGVSAAQLKRWAKQLGWESLLNKRGTTWRTIKTPSIEAQLNQSNAINLMQENPSLIKRPLIDTGETLLLGFDSDAYQSQLL